MWRGANKWPLCKVGVSPSGARPPPTTSRCLWLPACLLPALVPEPAPPLSFGFCGPHMRVFLR